MSNQPVALECWNEGLDFGIDLIGIRGIGHGQEGKQGREYSKDPLLAAKFQEDINEHDGPGGEYERLVKIGKGGMSITQLVGFFPPQQKPHRLQDEGS